MMIFLATFLTSLPNAPVRQYLNPLYELQASHTALSGSIVHMAWESGGKQFVIGTLDGVLTTWDMQNQRKIREVKMGREIRAYVFTTKGRLFTQHADGTVALRSAQTGEVLRSFDFGDEGKYGKRKVSRIYPLPGGRCQVVIYDDRHGHQLELIEIDPDRGASPSQRREQFFVICPHRDRGIRLESPKRIVLVDVQTQKPLRTLDVAMKITDVAFSHDCRRLAVLSASALTIKVYEATTGKRVAKIGMALSLEKPSTLWWSPDGRYIAVSRENGEVELFSLTTRKRIARIGGGGSYYTASVAFSPDGQLLAVWSSENYQRVRIYKIPQP